MDRSVLRVVDVDAAAGSGAAQTLARRFGADYRVLAASSPREGLAALELLAGGGAEVALLAADLLLPAIGEVEFLGRALHPDAGRALLIEIGDAIGDSAAMGTLQSATALGAAAMNQDRAGRKVDDGTILPVRRQRQRNRSTRLAGR